MSARVQLEGLDAFYDALRKLPEDLAHEAGVVIEAQASEMARAAQAAYPEGPTGNLRAGVTMEVNRSKWGSSAIVRSRARHAWIFEHGSKPRVTRRGAARGVMPKAPRDQAFIPKAIAARRRITEALIEIVRRAGFEVTGA